MRTSWDRPRSCNLEDVRACQVFIVTVPTPVDQANRPDMTPLVKASETVGKIMPCGAVVILEFTVYSGATEEVPVLKKFRARSSMPTCSRRGYFSSLLG